MTANDIIYHIENLEQTVKDKESKEYHITLQVIAYLGINYHKFLIDRYINHLSLSQIAKKYNTRTTNIKYYSNTWKHKVYILIRQMKANNISFDIDIDDISIESNTQPPNNGGFSM